MKNYVLATSQKVRHQFRLKSPVPRRQIVANYTWQTVIFIKLDF